jgi:hypothetical protein
MRDQVLFTLKVAEQIFKVPQHRLIHLCETGVVEPVVDAKGRGSVRRFSRDNLFVLALALRLQDMGLMTEQMGPVKDLFDWLPRMRILREEIAAGGLVGVIESLGSPENPALLHIVMPEAGMPPDSMWVAIESSRKLPQPPKSKMSFHTDDSQLRVCPARLVVNLTHTCRMLRSAL